MALVTRGMMISMTGYESLGICYKCLRTSFGEKMVCGITTRSRHGWDLWSDFKRKVNFGKKEYAYVSLEAINFINGTN